MLNCYEFCVPRASAALGGAACAGVLWTTLDGVRQGRREREREEKKQRRGEKKKKKRRICEEAVMDSQSALAELGVA